MIGNDQNGLPISCVNGVKGPLVRLLVGGKFATQNSCEIISIYAIMATNSQVAYLARTPHV
jgi:hypothetical protein